MKHAFEFKVPGHSSAYLMPRAFVSELERTYPRVDMQAVLTEATRAFKSADERERRHVRAWIHKFVAERARALEPEAPLTPDPSVSNAPRVTYVRPKKFRYDKIVSEMVPEPMNPIAAALTADKIVSAVEIGFTTNPEEKDMQQNTMPDVASAPESAAHIAEQNSEPTQREVEIEEIAASMEGVLSTIPRPVEIVLPKRVGPRPALPRLQHPLHPSRLVTATVAGRILGINSGITEDQALRFGLPVAMTSEAVDGRVTRNFRLGDVLQLAKWHAEERRARARAIEESRRLAVARRQAAEERRAAAVDRLAHKTTNPPLRPVGSNQQLTIAEIVGGAGGITLEVLAERVAQLAEKVDRLYEMWNGPSKAADDSGDAINGHH